MKLGVLFSGGKDSTYATFLAKKEGYEIACLISIVSDNKSSYMFHTPAITLVKKQAELMGIPILIKKTKGEKERELVDLKKAIFEAKEKFGIQGILTGAVESVYQASRIQNICHEQGLECFNPLWQKNQIELLEEMLKEKFKIIISGVFAYPLNEKWVGRKVDKKFIDEMRKLNEKYKINPAGEGGEFESLVVNCPLFKKKLEVGKFEMKGEKNSWRIVLK